MSAYLLSERKIERVSSKEDADLSVYSFLDSILHLHVSSARVIVTKARSLKNSMQEYS
jgi:hypothetical protein